ncbi:MAG TPA: hypothetical protein VIM57_00550 [Luteolibacter sp.]
MKLPLLCLTLAIPATAVAGTPASELARTPAPITVVETPTWSYRVALYGWAQSLDGDVTVRGVAAPVDLKFNDLLQDLDMAFMGLAEVKRGRWGLLVDVNYAHVSDSLDPPFGGGSIEFHMRQWLINGYATYDIVHDGATDLDVFAGARFNSMELELETGLGTRANDKQWIDPVIGLRFQRSLSESFFFRAIGDIGGFGVSSDLTWQAFAGFGWRFRSNGNALLGYRAIDTDYDHGSFQYDVTAHGPVLGVEFTF